MCTLRSCMQPKNGHYFWWTECERSSGESKKLEFVLKKAEIGIEWLKCKKARLIKRKVIFRLQVDAFFFKSTRSFLNKISACKRLQQSKSYRCTLKTVCVSAKLGRFSFCMRKMYRIILQRARFGMYRKQQMHWGKPNWIENFHELLQFNSTQFNSIQFNWSCYWIHGKLCLIWEVVQFI